MRDINEVAKKMARNGLKIAKSLGCAFHFESEFRFISAYAAKHFELSNHCLLYNANIVKDISDLQRKYVKVKSLRRSG